MDKGQVWEAIKKYAIIFFQSVGMVFAYIFHYIGVFCVFVYKHAKVLFKKLYRIIRKHIRRVKKHVKAGDYSLLIYTVAGCILVIVLLCLLIHGISGKKKAKKTTTTSEITSEQMTTEQTDPMEELRNQASIIYQNNPDYLMLVNDTNPITAGYTFEQHTLNSGYIVDERIFNDLKAMLEACNAAGNEYTIKGGYVSADTEGSGEYATGLAFDVTAHDVASLEAATVATLPTNIWLMQNCSTFGFIVRYPEGKESITGHGYEPWHFRYVGRDAAVFMTTNNLTLEEFYTLLNGGSVATTPTDSVAPVTDPNAASTETPVDPNATTAPTDPGATTAAPADTSAEVTEAPVGLEATTQAASEASTEKPNPLAKFQ